MKFTDERANLLATGKTDGEIDAHVSLFTDAKEAMDKAEIDLAANPLPAEEAARLHDNCPFCPHLAA